MNENVAKFFELYAQDAGLRARVAEAEANYPGSLEIRESVVENVLLPIARDIGLEFDVKDLRKYETRRKMAVATQDPDEWLAEPDNGGEVYWLLDRGWTDDTEKYKT